MPIRLDELHKDHELIRAAHAMVIAHKSHTTALPALEQVQGNHPDVNPEHLIILWVGINAKDLKD